MPRDSGFNLGYVLTAIRRRLPIFVACILLVPAAAVAYSLTQKKEYTAKAQLLFRDPEFDQKLFGTSFVQNQTDPERAAATNRAVVSLPRVAALTAKRLHGMTEDHVRSAVQVSSEGQSDLVSVQATDRKPGFSAKLANTFATQYIAFRRKADRATISSAKLPLQRQIADLSPRERSGALGQSLKQRLGELSALASLQTGNAELLQPAQVPDGPSSPKPVRDGALGVFFGILLAVALVVLAEALDRRLREPAAVEELLGHPVVGHLPSSGPTSLEGADIDAIQILRANLDFLAPDQPLRSIAITSALAQEGKTTVAEALARAQARAGKSTLLLECDLRRPTLAQRAGVPAEPGLAEYLVGQAAPRDVTRSLSLAPAVRPSTNGEGPGHGIVQPGRLDIIPTGRLQPHTGVVLGSRHFRDFLAVVSRSYDVVILDCAPLLPVVDTLELIPQVDAVILCVRASHTTANEAQAVREVLGRLPARPTGVVLTGIRPGFDSPYPYYYQQAYASQAR